MNEIKPYVYTRVGSEPGKPLPQYTSLGCYPIVYYAKDMASFCAECAVNSDTDELIIDGEVNWEGPSVTCEHCGREIESAYGECSP